MNTRKNDTTVKGHIVGGLLCLSALILAGPNELPADDYNDKRPQYKQQEDDQYKSPLQMVLSNEGRWLYVTCENSSELLLVDTQKRKVVEQVAVGRKPYDVVLSPDEKTVYVSNRWDDNISVLDAARFEVVRTVPVGDDPHALMTDLSGRLLFVANFSADLVSVVSTDSYEEIKTFGAGKFPVEMARSPDGAHIYVTNLLSRPVPHRSPPVSEVTVIEVAGLLVAERRLLPSILTIQEIVFSPDGKLALAVAQSPNNMIPLTQIYQGWTTKFGLLVLETRPQGRAAFLLTDDVNQYYADPFAIVISPDGRFAYVSSSALDVVSVIDMMKVAELLEIQDGLFGISDGDISRYSRSLGSSSEFVLDRIPVGKNPKGMSLSRDGRFLYVANRLSDSISIIDTERRAVVGNVDLGGPKTVTDLRYGEQLFNNSHISFQNQLSCLTCHPEEHKDGLVWDIAIDGGMGRNLVSNRTMRGLAGTEPFKWSGKNPTLQRQEGPRAAQLIFRSHGFEPDGVEALAKFLESIPISPNRFCGPGGELNEAQRRGKYLYQRAYTNAGSYIPVSNRCITCHPPPLYTNGSKCNVGSQAYFDTEKYFDPPQLANLYEQVVFMHDARCATLEEIWTVFNPNDLHGKANDLTKLQLNDMVEYIKTLGTPPEDYEMDLTPYAEETGIGSRLKVGDIEALTVPADKYVGTNACRSCHPEAYRLWTRSRHSRAWVDLRTSEARQIADKVGMSVDSIATSAKCLVCHGTAATVAEDYRAPELHIEDGVQCEACHGPGGKHGVKETTENMETVSRSPLRRPDETFCLKCHGPEPSHSGLSLKPFYFEERWKKIAHSE